MEYIYKNHNDVEIDTGKCANRKNSIRRGCTNKERTKNDITSSFFPKHHVAKTASSLAPHLVTLFFHRAHKRQNAPSMTSRFTVSARDALRPRGVGMFSGIAGLQLSDLQWQHGGRGPWGGAWRC